MPLSVMRWGVIDVGAVGAFVGGAVVGFFVHVGARVGPYVGGAGAAVGS